MGVGKIDHTTEKIGHSGKVTSVLTVVSVCTRICFHHEDVRGKVKILSILRLSLAYLRILSLSANLRIGWPILRWLAFPSPS